MMIWRVANIIIHAVWLGLFVYLFNWRGVEKVDYDSLAVSMSAMQTLLAVFALIGFGIVAVLADRAARETARRKAEDVVKSELPAMVKRELSELADLKSVLGQETMTETPAAQDAANSLDGDTR